MEEIISTRHYLIIAIFVMVFLGLIIIRLRKDEIYGQSPDYNQNPQNEKHIAQLAKTLFFDKQDITFTDEGSKIEIKHSPTGFIFVVDNQEVKDPKLIQNPKLRKRFQSFQAMLNLTKQGKQNIEKNTRYLKLDDND